MWILQTELSLGLCPHRDAQKVVRNVQKVFQPLRVGLNPLRLLLRRLGATWGWRHSGGGARGGGAAGDGGRGHGGGSGHRPVQLLQTAAAGGRRLSKVHLLAEAAERRRVGRTQLKVGGRDADWWWGGGVMMAVGEQESDWLFFQGSQG